MQASTNYIYIIFAVLYVIYSVIKASKKAQQKSTTQNQKPQPSSTVQPPTASPLPKQKPEDDFKKMLEDLLGGAPEIKIPERQIPKVESQTIPIKPHPVKISTHSPQKEKVITAPTKPFSIKPKITSEKVPFIKHSESAPKVFAEPMHEEESGVDNFDIREAIIYSEILKRPNW
ncbi:MAG: hypothetical protein AABZ32_01215 [Bacteroidota bacterium]